MCYIIFLTAAKVRPAQKWNWPAILAFLLILLICLILLALYLFCRRRKEDAADAGTGPAKVVPAPATAGHGTVRSYSDQGAGEEDNKDYDLRHLMKYMYSERTVGKVDLDHGHEHASIRVYDEPGVQGTDTHQFDLKQLMTYR